MRSPRAELALRIDSIPRTLNEHFFDKLRLPDFQWPRQTLNEAVSRACNDKPAHTNRGSLDVLRDQRPLSVP